MEVKDSPVSESPEINESASTESQSTPHQEVIPTEEIVVKPTVGDGVGSGGEGSGQVSAEISMRRKRGRPRKCEISGTASHLSEPPPKRRRGRPRGSGRIQFLTSLGGCGLETAGGCFTPHVLELKAGQDIVPEISSLAVFPRAAIVLAAAGALSSVVIARPGQAGGFVRYDGYFQILSLNGIFIFSEVDGTPTPRNNGYLSIVLAHPDGGVFGGAVTGCLIAANPIQLVVGTFKQTIHKTFRRRMFRGESSSLNAVNDGLASAMAAIPIPVIPSLGNNGSAMPTPAMSNVSQRIHVEAAGPSDAGSNQLESPTPLRVCRCQNNSEASLPMSPENDNVTPQTLMSKDESENCC
ncbi:AT-hook motif nuclear-localized protein 11-like [Tripterygium wilfordii]|uniref:AT-hook motif nuclear-localized protein 11-like n=1 Tax=Tripterygium wilfordii TaxID=458696 RepID=UPI0018F85CE7|nr:AT-hook motif nuclear-localized protein 11-like [Tripterygium wilfordii]